MESTKHSKKQEDLYFAREEFDRQCKIMEQKRKQLEEAERESLKETHWMRCPKCGNEMVNIEFEGIELDKCTNCLGIFFDNGELDELLGKKAGFIDKIFKVFKD